MTRKSLSVGIVLITASLMLPVAGWRLYVKQNRDEHAATVTKKLMEAVAAGKIDKVTGELNSGTGVDQVDGNGCTPLMVAVTSGQAKMVELLLARGADVNRKCSLSGGGQAYAYASSVLSYPVKDSTPLLMCARTGNAAIGKMLIDRGADVKAIDAQKNNAVSLAMQTTAGELLRLLVQKGASINVTGRNGESLLMYSITINDTPLALAALNREGCNVNTIDVNRETALLQSARLNSMPGVAVAIARTAADVDCTDGTGKSALAYAAYNGRADLVKELLHRGAEFDKPDKNGDRPLINAAIRGDAAIVNMLVHAGAHVNVKDKNGMSALQWAVARNYTEIAATLRSAGAHGK